MEIQEFHVIYEFEKHYFILMHSVGLALYKEIGFA
jgi:hypothetical protein